MTAYVGYPYVMQAMALFERVADAAEQSETSHQRLDRSALTLRNHDLHAEEAYCTQIVIRADQEKRHGDPGPQTKYVGEAKIDAGGDVKLPDDVLRAVDWKQGDQLWITVVDGDHVVLSKRPEDIVEYFAGAFTHLYPDPEDTRRFLDEGCGYGDDSDPETEA